MSESAADEGKRLGKLAIRYEILGRQMVVLHALESVCEIPMREDGADRRAFDLRDLVALAVLENCERIYELSAPPAVDDDLPF